MNVCKTFRDVLSHVAVFRIMVPKKPYHTVGSATEAVPFIFRKLVENLSCGVFLKYIIITYAYFPTTQSVLLKYFTASTFAIGYRQLLAFLYL